MRYYGLGLKSKFDLFIFKFRNFQKEKFECPVCGYSGPFLDIASPEGPRKHARCPNCTALERHRIQFVVVNEVLRDRNTTHLKMLHVAPNHSFASFSHSDLANMKLRT